jgi:hypothetical protein
LTALSLQGGPDEPTSSGTTSRGQLREERFLPPVRHDLRPTQAAPGAAGQASIAEQFRHAFPDLQVAEIWNHRDDLGLMDQLGAAVFAVRLGRSARTGLGRNLAGCGGFDPLSRRSIQRRNRAHDGAGNLVRSRDLRPRGWSVYGAWRSQPVATHGKWEGPRNGSNKPKPLPPVATSCHRAWMVKRGSIVGVCESPNAVPWRASGARPSIYTGFCRVSATRAGAHRAPSRISAALRRNQS